MADIRTKLRIALTIISAIGFILYVVAFSLPKWSQRNSEYNGIWHICFINGGEESCAVWPEYLKTTLLQTTQVFSCLGLASYLLFVLSGTMSLFWTRRWTAARKIKFSTSVLAVLAFAFVTASVAVYNIDKGSDTHTVTCGWYFALIAALVAGILAPFYFFDAYNTAAPKQTDRELFFRKINNPPRQTFGIFEKHQGLEQLCKGRRPPLLRELRQQQITFVQPLTKAKNKTPTFKKIKSFSLPLSKPGLDLLDKTETENNSAPQKLQTKRIKERKLGTLDHELKSRNEDLVSPEITSLECDQEIDMYDEVVFKFNKTECMAIKHLGIQWEQEQA